ncbi:sugar transferase [Apibacter sp.]|uniref:sugar transferase n=1 Tax=Apibacter sp. TaxID=2023709 RepID=UPI0026014463|nr:sugar transferase [Apibacter sp.]MCT6869933.1 sugar transferase [Apibacter sp.]
MKNSKIILDYLLAILCLIIFIFPILFIFIFVTIDIGMSGFFIQERVGKNGKAFNLYKFRTMKGEYSSSITTGEMRITKLGKFLRRYKLDEIPQIFNILKGDMSWVGPRPDVFGYADKLEGEDRIILSVKPGITGPAQLKYRNEEEILSKVKDPKLYNDNIIWKDKVKINKDYIENWSFTNDVNYLLRTIFVNKNN